MQTLINQISDTALWVAMYRALETRSADAVFKDHLAEKLAGERGLEMVNATPYSDSMAFAMVVRTSAIDRLIEKALTFGVDTVINLGCGLDTRPYRMNLPSGLNWIEVDFEHVIDYKNQVLINEKPVCKLERIASDLSDDKARRKLFSSLAGKTEKALIITEGVISYLNNEKAALLSEDLFETHPFKYWIQDYVQGKMRNNRQHKSVGKKLENTPWYFDVAKPVEFFCKDGWQVKENIFILDEADSINRKLPLVFPFNILMKIFPKIIRKIGNETYGYVLLTKQ